MKQRKTQSAEYWQKQFRVNDRDIEALYQHIFEQNEPIKLTDLVIALIKRQCDEEELATRTELQQGRLYQPKETYNVGEILIFPALDFSVGTVAAAREAHHPDYGSFSVISVDFKSSSGVKELATNFQHNHPLNMSEQSLANLQGLMSPDELYQAYKQNVTLKIKAALAKNDDFIEFQDYYFLRDALPEFHEGLFNIADAAIDINQGPLNVTDLIEQMGLDSSEAGATVTQFMVNYNLAYDERFEDVGPTGQILWYLERIQPPEVNHLPRRLLVNTQDYDPSLFDEDLYDLLADIDDETTLDEDAAPAVLNAKHTTIVLNYPHWRVGTLPLTPKTRQFFPTSSYNPVRFEFIDGRTGNAFPGWTVAEHDYVFGLDEWYQKNKLPVGTYVTIKRSNNPMQVIVEYKATRTQRDWVRMAKVINNKITFQMNPSALACKYDELMIISDATPANTDKLWVNAEERNLSLFDLICGLFPELSKLNPQSTVHVKTIYSAVNVVQRVGPGVIFQELVSHRCFIPINHGYWTYDPNLRE